MVGRCKAPVGEGSRDKDLMGVEEVARRLGLVPATVWRWCREGRLPCIKMGKSWRIRPEALEDFIRRSERPATLEGELGPFLRVPDNVLAVAQSPELSNRLDAGFLKVAEARDGLLVKFYGGEATDEDELRERLEKGGLDVGRLEREGRLYLREERDASVERVERLHRLLSDEAGAGLTLWVSFDWAERADLETTLRQQQALTKAVNSGRMVVKTALLEEIVTGWPPNKLRRVQALHSGTIWLSEDGLVLSRTKPLTGV